MGSSKPPAQTTTTQTSAPPAFLQPALEQAAQGAQDLYAQGPGQYFPGSTVVPFSAETNQALTGIADRATMGSPLVQGAQESALQTIQGRGVNPFLGQAVNAATAPMYEQFSNTTLPDLRSAFAGFGRSGSGAENRALQQAVTNFGRGVGEQGAKLAYTSAENEAARQLAATQLAPGLAQQDYQDLQALAGVGATKEAQAGATLQDQINRYNFSQNAQANQLNQLIAQLSGIGGGGTVTTTGQGAQATGGFGGQLLGGIGGAASGAALGSMIAPGPGTLIGAGVGGLAGLFG